MAKDTKPIVSYEDSFDKLDVQVGRVVGRSRYAETLSSKLFFFNQHIVTSCFSCNIPVAAKQVHLPFTLLQQGGYNEHQHARRSTV